MQRSHYQARSKISVPLSPGLMSEKRRLTLEVRLFALCNLLLPLDALDRAKEGDAHPACGEVAVSEPVHVVDRDGQVGRIGRQGIAVDL